MWTMLLSGDVARGEDYPWVLPSGSSSITSTPDTANVGIGTGASGQSVREFVVRDSSPILEIQATDEGIGVAIDTAAR